MIRDGKTLPDGGETFFDVIIVGAGAAGIALATRLDGRAGRVALVEAGDTAFRKRDNAEFFRAQDMDDDRHARTELYRRRMLGGTTSVWGGRCIPFDREDLEPTADRSGWPLSHADFSAYVPDASSLLDAGPASFSAGPVRAVNSPVELVLDRIERYSKPTNVWKKYRDHLGRSRDITVIHSAACTEILVDPDGQRAAGIELRTGANAVHRLSANTVVVACGGLETPRLLLASRKRRVCGVGNSRDLVGRHYMTHLVSSAANAGILRFKDPSCATEFDFMRTEAGIYIRRLMLLSPQVRRRERLPNIAFRPTRPPMDDAAHHNAVLSAMFLVRHAVIPPEYMRSMGVRLGRMPMRVWRAHLGNVLTDMPHLVSFGTNWVRRRIFADRKLPSVFLHEAEGNYPLEFNAEQLPNPDSRILIGDETDRSGMPRLIVRWRFDEAELEAICRAYRIFAASVAQSGLGTVELGPELTASVRQCLVPQGGHHMGTAKMGADQACGVTNADCEVWDTPGLFLAGTSIFATSGYANPTLTAVALALRLADHLVDRRNVFARLNNPEAMGTQRKADRVGNPHA